MANSGEHSSAGFTISYFDRLPKGGAWLGDLDISAQGWRHDIAALGGFGTASFDLSDHLDDMEDWILNGLFRPIIVRDNYLTTIWEGYVDSIAINQAGLSVTHGPLSTISNHIYGVYSGLDTTVNPPQFGARKKTPIQDDLPSQAAWGVWPLVLSLAGVTDANAVQLTTMYLAEHGHPEINSNFSFTGAEISLTVNCVGWMESLRYPFNYTSSSGEISIDQRIQQILNAHPNPGWISNDYTGIIANATTVPLFEDDDQLAMEHIRGITAMGDANNLRHIFGIYEGRKPIYETVSQQIDYTLQIRDPRRQLYDASGSLVAPWKLRPGKWLFFSDFIPGLGSPFDDFHADPRMLRIESVTFDMRTPFAVQFSGGISSKYEQQSARLGLRGVEV